MEPEQVVVTQTEPDRVSVREVLTDISGNLETLFRAQARLAAAELKQNLRKSTRAGILLAGAAVMSLLAAACFIVALIAALHIVLNLWVSALLIGVALASAAGGAFLLGRMALDEVDFLPQKAIENLKDNIDWLKNRAG